MERLGLIPRHQSRQTATHRKTADLHRESNLVLRRQNRSRINRKRKNNSKRTGKKFVVDGGVLHAGFADNFSRTVVDCLNKSMQDSVLTPGAQKKLREKFCSELVESVDYQKLVAKATIPEWQVDTKNYLCCNHKKNEYIHCVLVRVCIDLAQCKSYETVQLLLFTDIPITTLPRGHW